MYRNFLKPALDLAIAIPLSLLTLPFIAALSILILIDSRGFPIFTQLRIGKDRKPFRMFKLRTMVKDADKRGPLFTADQDPRITRIGKILRRTSLDELPQLWNVALLEMSVIGPRPATPNQESQYPPEVWKKRHEVRPGITGLAQTEGRSALTLEEQCKFDVAYVDSLSSELDLRIAIATVRVVAGGLGVN